MQEILVNPQNFQENFGWNWDVQTPDPIRADTQACLNEAQRLIHEVWISADPYNSLTESFESQRETCRQNMCDLRGSLSEDISRLLTTPIEEMTPEELQEGLQYTQEEYQNFSWWRGTRLLRWLWSRLWIETSNTIERLCDIQDKTHANLAQERILNLLCWDWFVDNGYNQEYLHTFNNEEWGNQVINMSVFENSLQETPPSEWNSLALVNYFKMLDSQGDFNISMLLEKLGANQIIALWDLWKTSPNGPAMNYFQNNESLKWIVDGVTSISFESMIFSWDMENFEQISELFDAASIEDRQVIQDTIHGLLYNALYDGNIEQLRNIADIENIWGLNEWMYRFTKESARKMLLANETIHSLEALYVWGPDVSDIAKALILSAINSVGLWEDGEIQFSLDGINSIIQEYNAENNAQYPTLWDEYLQFLESIFNTNALIGEYGESLSRLSDINARISEIQAQLWDENIQSEEKEALQRELYWLYTQQYWTSRTASEQVMNLEEHMINLNNFNAHIINIDINNPEHVTFLLNDVQWRVWLIKNTDDFLVFYEQLGSEQQQNVNIDIISSSLLLDERVLRIFIERDTLRDNIIWQLPSQIFKDRQLCELIFKNGRFHYGVLINEMIANNAYDTSLEILRSFLELEDQNGEKILSNSENLRYFKMALNSEILQELFWDSWDEDENTIQNWERLLENIRMVWTPQMFASENQPNDPVSFEVIRQESSEFSTGYNETEHENSIMSYINSHEINNEILEVILERVANPTERYTWRLVNFILMRLNPNNSEHMDFAKQIVEANQILYIQLNSAFRIHPDIIQAMSQYNVPAQDNNDTYIFNALIRNIFNAENKYELFALYLQWLNMNWNSIATIRDRRIYESLIIRFFQERNEDWAIILNWELNENQSQIIEEFLEWDIERQEIDRLASILHQIDESAESDLREILNRNGISVEQSEVIINLVMSGDRWLTFQRALRDALLIWLSNTSENNKLEIAGWIIQDILDLRANTSNQIWQTYRTYLSDWLLNNTQLELMQWNRFLTENGGLNVDLILDDYQEQIRNWVITDSENDMELFISNLDIPEEIKRVYLDLIKEVINSQNIEWEDIIAAEIIRQIGDNAEITRVFWESNFDLYWNAREEFRRAVASWELRLSWNFRQNFQEYQEIRNNNTGARLSENWSISNLSTNFRERVENGTWGNFILTTADGRRIPVTRKDISIIDGSPEAERNLVNAYDIFQNEWLERIWQHKDSLMQAIGSNDTTGMQFNLRDGNYLDQREMNYLLSSILYITTENNEYREVWLSLDDTISKVRRETQWAFWEENVRNIGQWENMLENTFINKFTMRNQWDEGRFNFSAFSRALRWDFS